VDRAAQALDDYLSDRAKNAKLGDAGFVFHAGWPMPGEKNYKKNVMQDRRLTQMEKELEDRNIALEDYLKEKSRVRPFFGIAAPGLAGGAMCLYQLSGR
jgi:hypothetical protein